MPYQKAQLSSLLLIASRGPFSLALSFCGNKRLGNYGQENARSADPKGERTAGSGGAGDSGAQIRLGPSED